jgi:hypothetical protein
MWCGAVGGEPELGFEAECSRDLLVDFDFLLAIPIFHVWERRYYQRPNAIEISTL